MGAFNHPDGKQAEPMPYWPMRMTSALAAKYMGVSQSTFLARFGHLGVKEGGNTLWARPQLDAIVLEQFNLASEGPSAPPMSAEDEYDAWKRGRGR